MVESLAGGFGHRDTLGMGKHRPLVARFRHRDDDFVEKVHGAEDDVHMAIRDGIECTGIDNSFSVSFHASSIFQRL